MLPKVTVAPGLTGVPANPDELFDSFINEFCNNIDVVFLKCPHISSGSLFNINELWNNDIEISEETPSDYGVLGIKGLLKGIKEEWPNLPEEAIESINSQNINCEWIYNVAGIISCNTNETSDKIIRCIKDIMKNPEYYGKSYMLGKYNHAKRHITLYHNSIVRHAKIAKCFIEDVYKAVYLHELFHAYHHLCGDKISRELSSRSDYTAVVVKESLAAFFESCCDDRSAWYLNSPANWPYAGARYITDNDFFAEIFCHSLTDFDAALRKLLVSDPDEFYDVKNVIRISASGVPDDIILKAFAYYMKNDPKGKVGANTIERYKRDVKDVIHRLGISLYELYESFNRYHGILLKSKYIKGLSKKTVVNKESALNKFKKFCEDVLY